MEDIVAYSYSEEKHKIFTEEGQVKFLQVRDRAKHLLKESGAFKMFPLLNCISGDMWEMMAYVDRLVELGEIREITMSAAGQDRVFVLA
jgi:hypothetical protein